MQTNSLMIRNELQFGRRDANSLFLWPPHHTRRRSEPAARLCCGHGKRGSSAAALILQARRRQPSNKRHQICSVQRAGRKCDRRPLKSSLPGPKTDRLRTSARLEKREEPARRGNDESACRPTGRRRAQQNNEPAARPVRSRRPRSSSASASSSLAATAGAARDATRWEEQSNWRLRQRRWGPVVGASGPAAARRTAATSGRCRRFSRSRCALFQPWPASSWQRAAANGSCGANIFADQHLDDDYNQPLVAILQQVQRRARTEPARRPADNNKEEAPRTKTRGQTDGLIRRLVVVVGAALRWPKVGGGGAARKL